MRVSLRSAARLLASLATLLIALSLTPAARAQEQVWIQIEARPSLAEATERAEAYAAYFPQTHGFRLPSGWYGIALGPYDPVDAAANLARLKAENMIPRDSYTTDGRDYLAQFWPAAGALPVPVAPAEALPDASPEAPLAEVIPVPEAPAAVEIPEETPAEARVSEAQLAPQDRQELQVALQWFGFYQGGIDGAFGPGTRKSMADWQAALGLEPSGILTTRQRTTLVANYHAEVAEFGFAPLEEREAGITVTLPLSLVEFDRYEPPFVHFRPKDGSGLSIILISQPGDAGTFAGLYDLLQTLEDMPPTGPRALNGNEFSIEGRGAQREARAWAKLERGMIKGWMVLSAPENAARDARLIEILAQSFRAVGDAALDPGMVPLDEAARRGLVAGLEVKRPRLSRSGFYLNDKGQVLTTAEAVAQCGRITLDRAHEASVTLTDPATGIAVLTPAIPLAPPAYAAFQTAPARIGGEVTVSGYSYEDRLPAPVLTWGTLEALTGLDGEAGLSRLAIGTRAGDAGGPVLDVNGAVIGMLMPAGNDAARSLPEGTAFARDASALAGPLQGAGIAIGGAADTGAMPPETLTRHARGMTVLVSCWE